MIKDILLVLLGSWFIVNVAIKIYDYKKKVGEFASRNSEE